MRRRSVLAALVAGAMLGTRSGARADTAPADVWASLAPTGRLRVAINYGNAVLARRDPDGTLHGVSVDIAHELARRTGLPLDLVPFDAAGKVSAAASANVWDIAFLARDPQRAKEITFTAPYVVIDGTYVVRTTSPIRSVEDVDKAGVRVAVGARSAYDLFLTRSLKQAQLIRAPSTPEAVALFGAQRLEVLAGVKQGLVPVVAADPGLRMIETPFMAIEQAMGTPAGRAPGAAYLADFVKAIKADGFVAEALKRNGQGDASVAPP